MYKTRPNTLYTVFFNLCNYDKYFKVWHLRLITISIDKKRMEILVDRMIYLYHPI